MLEPVTRGTPKAARTPGITGRAVPDAASHHPVGALLGPFRIDHFIVRVTPKPVLAPLLDITEHVIEPPGIGLFPTHRLNQVLRVPAIPADGIQVVVNDHIGAFVILPLGKAVVLPARQAYSHSASVGSLYLSVPSF